MIYSYLDTLLDKWVEWSDGFLSQKMTSNINDVNTILGTTGSDNPSRANELYKIGVLKQPLTTSNDAFDALRKDTAIHSDFGYLSYLIRKAIKIDSNNQILNNGFKAVSAISLIQQYVEYSNSKISLNYIVYYLLDKFPIPSGVDDKNYLRYLTASMFCELNEDSNSFLKNILSNNTISLRIIEPKTKNVRISFNNSNDIVNAINNKTSLTSIIYEKGSVFFIGNPREPSPRGLFYKSYDLFSDFLKDHYQIEKNQIKKNPFSRIYDKTIPMNIVTELNSIFKNNPNYTKLMISLEQGCIAALNTLKWGNNIEKSKISNSKNKIYYGAPGTGKSHKVKELIQGNDKRTERVTFHPEYDYSSFVGGYKPTMDGDNIRYEFVPQAFTNIYTKAWNDLDNNYYLVIEEINRGNCAEIFGDIFQLLDRTNDYKITPSKELKEHLEMELKGNSNIDGEKLLLPPNLNILATMNTSDQSLFPMDSAFKRRWDWEYIPINYSREEDKNSSAKFVVKLSNEESFKWLDFIEKVNQKISKNDNLGMDKCLGNYFIKPKNDEIEIETFVNKAIFYLWNDVFKDETEEDSIFKNKTTYENFFPIDDENGKQKVRDILEDLKIDYKASI
jgi:hypothetical protein